MKTLGIHCFGVLLFMLGGAFVANAATGPIERHEPDSMLAFINSNASLLLAICGILITTLLAALSWLLVHHRYNNKVRTIFEASPARVIVADINGKILFIHAHNQKSWRQELLAVGYLKEESYPRLWQGIQQTIKTGKPLSTNYPDIHGLLRRADFRKLENSAFGREAVLIVSLDIEEMHQLQLKYKNTSTLLRDIIDNIPGLLWVQDVANNLSHILVNQHVCTILGKTEEQVINKVNSEILTSDVFEAFRQSEQKALAEGKAETQVRLLYPNGTPADIKVNQIVLSRPDGKKLLLSIGIDISELSKSRNALECSNELLRRIMDNLPCALFVKDADNDFRYLMYNRVFAEGFGLLDREVIGHSDLELLLPENAKLCRGSDIEVLAAGVVSDVQEVVILADGAPHTLRCIKDILPQSDGTKLLLGISMDISKEQKMLEEHHVYGTQQKMFNSALEYILLSDDFPSAINQVLKMVGEQIQADRSYIFTRDYESKLSHNSFEWVAEGIRPEIHNLQNLPLVLSTSWENALQTHQTIFSPDILNETNCKGVVESREILLAQNIKSVLVTGLWLDGKLWGFVGFDFVSKPITHPEISEKILASAAHIIEISLIRQARQQALERSEYEKKLIMDTIKTPIILYDGEMNLIRANNAARRIALIDPEKAVNEHIACNMVFCGEKDCPEHCPVRQSLHTLQESSSQLRIRGRDYLISANPIILDNKLEYILKTMIDITEFNSIQEKLRSALVDAQSASKAKSYFLATMSHELRTPLNAVIGFSELLQTGSLPKEEQVEYLQSINFAGNALLTLINDILDLSKIESGQVIITPTKSDFTALCKEIYSIFKLQASSKNLKFTLECPSDLPLLYLDSLRLRQILLNLTGNAIKFTNNGSVRLCAEFHKVTSEVGTLTIQVIDSGIGVSENGGKKIFEPFVQDSATRDRHAYQGTGLGLAISSRLVDQMSGTITLQSEVGKGSCFAVTLNNIKFVEQRAKNQKSLSAAVIPLVEKPTKALSMLLVDDVPINLIVLAAMLKKLGVTIRSTASGKEALELLKSWRPDMVLTDMWMPEMNGAELAKCIHKTISREEIKIIAVTADTEARNNFDAGEFDDIMLKPLTLDKLKSLVDALSQSQA